MVVAAPYEGIRLRWTVLLIGLMWVCQACGNADSQVEQDKNDQDQIDMKSSSSAIPDVPRRMLIKDVEWGNKKVLTVGVNTSFAGSTFAVETEITMTKRFGMTVWLFVPGIDDALNDDGNVFLGNSEERPYTFVCRYQGYADIDPKLREKLTLFGNGLSNEDYRKDSTGVLQTSKSFKVAIGESWPNIFKACQDYAAETNMMASVERDLTRMTKGLIYHDSKSQCMTDEHCEQWHSTLLPIVKNETVPVCQRQKNGTRSCAIAGKRETACSLYDKKSGARVTSGMFEYKCKSGLKCSATQKGGWFQNWQVYSDWKAECR